MRQTGKSILHPHLQQPQLAFFVHYWHTAWTSKDLGRYNSRGSEYTRCLTWLVVLVPSHLSSPFYSVALSPIYLAVCPWKAWEYTSIHVTSWTLNLLQHLLLLHLAVDLKAQGFHLHLPAGSCRNHAHELVKFCKTCVKLKFGLQIWVKIECLEASLKGLQRCGSFLQGRRLYERTWDDDWAICLHANSEILFL